VHNRNSQIRFRFQFGIPIIFGVKLSDEDIADFEVGDFEVLRDVAMATIFGFLYMGCTLVSPEEYD